MKQPSETIQKLNNSLEVHVIRRDLILSAVVLGFFSALSLLWFDQENWAVVLVIFVVATLPFFGHAIWRLIRIYSRPELYFFCKCKLSSPHQKLWTRGMMYFTVVIEDPEGGRFAADTDGIFAAYGMVGPLMEDYLNSTVTIAYNRETEMVVVIG